ncbi:uncharacterized protein MONBRDRAFT_30554 [Monosiga brevicollis MX1]|uniref:Histone-lysine N-methyltransferase n=1 Tax=Monosiga brevicollis TaxID=81824 RepID=A9V2P5_MONBE|nr:uncharacterized protein MONBRDRAFT_26549 [Monosiga brevicollis MX1]XP_001751054.1 uncharacterized protein MONBRDRAFT_30554 [Monosiga brevicollis MX1]EDQ84136.1 predicted protein [Monosiga brevicollis MX1]EDQ88409.1 predicted protein [Monosiga brevicollis MX1]|eukprot:XP_001747002.1 hypothetical protein [Monosiga brevicollis MX1]
MDQVVRGSEAGKGDDGNAVTQPMPTPAPYTSVDEVMLPARLQGRNNVYSGCSCTGPCAPETCSCLCNGRARYYECNDNCACDVATCRAGRTTQQPTALDIRLVWTSERGHGLLTGTRIPVGTYVGHYTGQLVNVATARARDSAADAVSPVHTYLLVLREHTQRGVLTTAVDAKEYGNLTRFINHSCAPNLELRPVRLGFVPRLAFFALTDIPAETELTFDYGGAPPSAKIATTLPADTDTGAPRHKRHVTAPELALSAKPCRCGAPTCRGFLPLTIW